MTKKDYEKAARIAQSWGATDAHQCVIEAFAELFTGNNARFDVGRFRAACVPGANVRARPKKGVA